MAENGPQSGIGTFVYTGLLLVFNMIYFGASLIVSHLTHCLTLRMDSNYVLFIVGSLVVSMIDMKLRHVRSVKNTFGWARIEFLGSLFNATFLASLSFSAAVHAAQLLIHLAGHSAHAHGIHRDELTNIIIFGVVRFLLGAITFAVRYGMRDSRTNFQVNYTQTAGVELCVLSQSDRCDAHQKSVDERTTLRSVITSPNVPFSFIREFIGPATILTCGLIVRFYGDYFWYRFVDPALCLVQILLLAITMFPHAKESSLALMLTIPTHLDINAIQERLLEKFSIIRDVHDFHLWRSSRHRVVVSCHLVCDSLPSYVEASSAIERFFIEEGVSEVTIQPEVLPYADTDPQVNATMTPNACACCDASPTCCSLKDTKDMGARRRIIAKPTPEMVDLEAGSGCENGNDSGTDEPSESSPVMPTTDPAVR